MLYFPLLIYSLHACLICIVCAEIVPKTSLKPKRLKNCNFSTKCLITPPLDTPSSRSYSILEGVSEPQHLVSILETWLLTNAKTLHVLRNQGDNHGDARSVG